MYESPPKKIHYVSSQEFRYELSLDEYSRERFRTLMALYKELQAQIPQVPISFCMYGSLVKGKVLTAETAPNADIDLAVMYDEETSDIEMSKNKKELVEKLEFFIEETILKRIGETQDSLGLKEINFNIKPINSTSIQTAVNNIAHSAILNVANHVLLTTYFTLWIGEAVKKYRDKFLKELAAMQNTEDAEEAERTWNVIKNCVEVVERLGQIPEKARKQFPQTIEEALKFYEVK